MEQAFRFGPKVLAASSKTLVRSNDEGRTWQHVFSIPGKHYGSFGFLSSSVGFYVDESHRIFRTDDGGSTWSLETRADRELREALFLSEKEALVQDVPPPTPDNGKKPFLWTPLKTLRSTDSGRHWRPIKGPFGSLFGGYRLDHDHWWILAEPLCRFPAPGCDRQLWRTTDGGRHWDLILGSAVDPPLTFVSPKMGFAGSPASGLYRTTDGGLTWQGVVRPQ